MVVEWGLQNAQPITTNIYMPVLIDESQSNSDGLPENQVSQGKDGLLKAELEMALSLWSAACCAVRCIVVHVVIPLWGSRNHDCRLIKGSRISAFDDYLAIYSCFSSSTDGLENHIRNCWEHVSSWSFLTKFVFWPFLCCCWASLSKFWSALLGDGIWLGNRWASIMADTEEKLYWLV